MKGVPRTRRKRLAASSKSLRPASRPGVLRWLGSIRLAVPLLIVLAGVLAWGTIYEARFGTAAVQRFIYHSWWFQGLLGFLALNLAAAALERWPWGAKHIPFVLAHIGIILILLGGILGGRFGIEGQLIIPEGQSERVLRLPENILVIHEPNPGVAHIIPTTFETQAWVHEPNTTFAVPLKDRILQVTVDRYFPNAKMDEEVTGDGTEDNPAVRLVVSQEGQEEALWLFANDAQRFGARWQEAHLLFLAPHTQEELAQLLGTASPEPSERGVVVIEFPALKVRKQLPVPRDFSHPVPIEGTPYTVTFKDSFTDFAITEQGVVNRSTQPNNPALAMIITGPEGAEPFLAFALHPDFPLFHGEAHKIHAHVTYTLPGSLSLPPNAICVVRHPHGELSWVLTGPTGERRVETVALGGRVTHPWLGDEIKVAAYYPRATILQHFTNGDNEIRSEALHMVVRDGKAHAEAWLSQGMSAKLALDQESLVVDYRQAERELPVTIKLLDFRKIDYPGIALAAGFESDVELTDAKRGVILMRKISMNHPLAYRGLTFYQASYIPGSPDTTVLAVRSDPGTPLVYAGFVVVIAGVVSLFLFPSKMTRTGEGARA